MTLGDVASRRSTASNKVARASEPWSNLTPKTLLFVRFFALMKPGWSSAELVEALTTAGMDRLMLETLPEGVLASLQEAIVQCQAEPPMTWNKDLLAIVGREDVNVLLSPGQRRRRVHTPLLVRLVL